MWSPDEVESKTGKLGVLILAYLYKFTTKVMATSYGPCNGDFPCQFFVSFRGTSSPDFLMGFSRETHCGDFRVFGLFCGVQKSLN